MTISCPPRNMLQRHPVVKQCAPYYNYDVAVAPPSTITKQVRKNADFRFVVDSGAFCAPLLTSATCLSRTTFSLQVLSATGSLAREADTFYNRLVSMLASKWDHTYSCTLCWLRCRLAFSLLRSSIQAIRGARSLCGHAIKMPMVVDQINSESHLASF